MFTDLKISKGSGSLKVIPVQEGSLKLTQSKGVLLYAFSNQDKNTELGLQYKLESTEVKSVSLGYYYTSTQPTLTPVYVFRGEGYDRVNKRLVQTTTIVSALPNENTNP